MNKMKKQINRVLDSRVVEYDIDIFQDSETKHVEKLYFIEDNIHNVRLVIRNRIR